MLTPAGKECNYFYGDYYRGRKHEECRLIKHYQGALQWSVVLCKDCPLPDILRANACSYMTLSAEVVHLFFVFGKKVQVSAHCTKTNQSVAEPYIGCGQCHPLPPVLLEDELSQE
jgi:hypothetical protein